MQPSSHKTTVTTSATNVVVDLVFVNVAYAGLKL
jgi:hypothetical protein